MTATAGQSLVEGLSDPDKDALIVRLWRDLQEERSRSKRLEAELLRAAGQHGPGKIDAATLRRPCAPAHSTRLKIARTPGALGRRLGLLRSRVALSMMLLLALGIGLDQAIGRYQHHRMDQKRRAMLELEHAAYQGVYLEVVNVAYGADQKSYRLTMKMTNVERGRSIYVMQTPVRVFEQAGLAWKEVPARAGNADAGTVVKLNGAYVYETVFEPNLKDWTELMPGYMHIRFESTSLISQRSDPDDDLIERTDRYYVYLKPHDADDEAIRRRMKIAGEPPLYMPMPPH